MAKKIEGLEIVSRDSKTGTAEYLYRGVRISKYTQAMGHKTRIRGGYSRAGVKFSFKIEVFRANASVNTDYWVRKDFVLKSVVQEIESWLSKENVIAENGKIITGVSDREILREKGEWNG